VETLERKKIFDTSRTMIHTHKMNVLRRPWFGLFTEIQTFLEISCQVSDVK
jgi:hypothetical protein